MIPIQTGSKKATAEPGKLRKPAVAGNKNLSAKQKMLAAALSKRPG